MNMDRIKDFLNNRLEDIIYRTKNSVVFNILIEKYEHLELYHQKWIKAVSVFLLVLIVLSLPFSIYISSIQSIHEFKTKKYLISEMIQSEFQNVSVQDFTEVQFDTKISNIIDKFELSSEQEIDVFPMSGRPQLPPRLQSLKYSGKEIEIDGINIKKVVEIGQKLDTISPSVRLIRLKIKESKNKENYFQATYTLIYFHSPNENDRSIKPLPKIKESA